ncbi:hypothetical protein SeLEV6574_g06452 [Synchytrium endobioticum]|uniref:Phosphodiesterase n=1 Tax=Synchytrium endobioticum TaxID=286115 RepID=A0A507CNK6_9FUNG|nr:hypothetical protein SeLEV6574_g06452 [Synchytrium endobioticum]
MSDANGKPEAARSAITTLSHRSQPVAATRLAVGTRPPTRRSAQLSEAHLNQARQQSHHPTSPVNTDASVSDSVYPAVMSSSEIVPSTAVEASSKASMNPQTKQQPTRAASIESFSNVAINYNMAKRASLQPRGRQDNVVGAHSPRPLRPPPSPQALLRNSDHASIDKRATSRAPPTVLRTTSGAIMLGEPQGAPAYLHPPAYTFPIKSPDAASQTTPTHTLSNYLGLLHIPVQMAPPPGATDISAKSVPTLPTLNSLTAPSHNGNSAAQENTPHSASKWTLSRNQRPKESSLVESLGSGIVFPIKLRSPSNHTLHFPTIRKITLGEESLAPSRRKSSFFRHSFRGSVVTNMHAGAGNGGSASVHASQLCNVEIQPFPAAVDPEITFDKIINRKTLTFVDPNIEHLFLSEFLELRRPLWKAASVFGILGIVAITVYSVCINDERASALLEGVLTAFGGILPFLLILYCSCTNAAKFADEIVALVILVISVVSSVRLRLADSSASPYKSAVSIVLICLMCSAFLRVRHHLIMPVLAFVLVAHTVCLVTVPNFDYGNAVISILIAAVACVATSVASRVTEYLYRAYFAKVQGLDGSAKKLMEQWRTEAISKISKFKRDDNVEGRGGDIVGSNVFMETPLEKAGLVIRKLLLDPTLNFEHARSLDIVLALLASADLMSPEIQPSWSNAADADQHGWLFALSPRRGTADVTAERRVKEEVWDEHSLRRPNSAVSASTVAAMDVRKRPSFAPTLPKSRQESVEKLLASQAGEFAPHLEMKMFTPPMAKKMSFIESTRAYGSTTAKIETHYENEEAFDSDASSLEDTKANVALAALLDQVHHWNWEVFTLKELSKNKPLVALGSYLFRREDLLVKLGLNETKMLGFLNEVDKGYNDDVPYHNSCHAADVLHGVHFLKTHCSAVVVPSELELLALYTGALIHDFNHPGVNNNFLISTTDHRALLYNDRSVLENYHLAAAFTIMANPQFDFMASLSVLDRRFVRNLVIELVLATDLQGQHYPTLTTFKNKVGFAGSFDPKNSTEDRLLLFKMMIKCADVGNPTKAWHLYDQWTCLILEEFFAQGDQEKALGLPVSPYCDRDNINLPACQIGFIEFICIPLYEAFDAFVAFPAALENLHANRAQWLKVRDSEQRSPPRPEEMQVPRAAPASGSSNNNPDVVMKKRGSLPISPTLLRQLSMSTPASPQQNDLRSSSKWGLVKTSKSVLNLTKWNGRRGSQAPSISANTAGNARRASNATSATSNTEAAPAGHVMHQLTSSVIVPSPELSVSELTS